MSDIIEVLVTDENFKQEVLDADMPVLVDFWAEWCGPCKMIASSIAQIAEEYKDKVKVCKLNVEEGPQTSSTYGVASIPTIILFKEGKVVETVVGAVPKGNITARIDQHI